jgi:hypothetical protein
MAEAATPAKRKRASGPRQARPVFAVVQYQDEQGQQVALAKDRLRITLERDAGKLLELVTGEAQGSTVIKVELPQSTPRAASAQAAGSAA